MNSGHLEFSMDPIEQVRAFGEAIDLDDKWSTARQLKSSKVKPSGEEFYALLGQGFNGLGRLVQSGDDPSRLIALDLLVRLAAMDQRPSA
jgi:hypothetical protein